MTSPTLLYLVKQTEAAIRARLDDVVADEGLTTAQYTALTVLERHPGMTASELARTSFVRPQSTAQLVGALEDMGAIRRDRHDDDRRRVRVFLSPQGERMLTRLRAPVALLEERMVATLGEEARSAYRAALIASRASLDVATA